MIALLAEVGRVIEELRPLLRMDGGDVFVRLKGHCIGCPISALTVKQGLEVALRQQVAGVERVLAVS